MAIKILDLSAHSPTCEGAEVTIGRRLSSGSVAECAADLEAWDFTGFDSVILCPEPRPFDEAVRALLPSGRVVVPVKGDGGGWIVELPEDKPKRTRKPKAEEGGD